MPNDLSIRRIDHPSPFQLLIEEIGESGFESELLSVLNQTCGAEHFAIFSIGGLCPTELAAASLDGSNAAQRGAGLYVQGDFWKRDPTMSAARLLGDSSRLDLFRLDIAGLQDRRLRDVVYPKIGDRLLLSGLTKGGRLAVSLLKSGAGNLFSTAEMRALEEASPMLLAVLGKHAIAKGKRQDLLRALNSLEHIEHSVARMAEHFPRRENQVCARMIFGMPSTAIASELGISEETVATYRKRIYLRIGLSTQRDLVMWYMSRLLGASGVCVARTQVRH